LRTKKALQLWTQKTPTAKLPLLTKQYFGSWSFFLKKITPNLTHPLTGSNSRIGQAQQIVGFSANSPT